MLLDFNRFVPLPPEIVAAGYANSHTWCEQNWNTRTNAYPGTTVHRTCDTHVRFSFDTAWSPPRSVVVAMAAQFPLLSFELGYWEPGVGFVGTLICVHGVVVLDECYAWSFDEARSAVTDDPGVEARLEDLEDLWPEPEVGGQRSA